MGKRIQPIRQSKRKRQQESDEDFINLCEDDSEDSYLANGQMHRGRKRLFPVLTTSGQIPRLKLTINPPEADIDYNLKHIAPTLLAYARELDRRKAFTEGQRDNSSILRLGLHYYALGLHQQIPEEWQAVIHRQQQQQHLDNPEYQEYLRLHRKFGGNNISLESTLEVIKPPSLDQLKRVAPWLLEEMQATVPRRQLHTQLMRPPPPKTPSPSS